MKRLFQADKDIGGCFYINSRINRTYKDHLFVFLFGREERKEWTLELYNAVNGTHYTDPSVFFYKEKAFLPYSNSIFPSSLIDLTLARTSTS